VDRSHTTVGAIPSGCSLRGDRATWKSESTASCMGTRLGSNLEAMDELTGKRDLSITCTADAVRTSDQPKPSMPA
jgi:hypothetical protein